MIRFREYLLLEGQRKDIQELQPNTVLTVFHGSDLQTIIKFVKGGIDAKKKIGRLYPHSSEGKKVDRGLYVSPDLETALHFGYAVIKFKVTGKSLWPMFPTRNKMSSDDKYHRVKYPKSFRPTVSYDMLDRGKGQESQALFIGLISPRAIERVYLQGYKKDGSGIPAKSLKYDSSFTRSEFIKFVDEVLNKSSKKFDFGQDPIVEPQEINISPKELIDRLHRRFSHMSRKELVALVLDNSKDARSLEQLIPGMSYTTAKHMWRKIKGKKNL